MSLSLNGQLLSSCSDDSSIRLWTTNQFSHHNQPTTNYKSRNTWRSPEQKKVKRASFCGSEKLAASTHGGGVYFFDVENLKKPEWFKQLTADQGLITDLITAPDMEQKGQIIFATSSGHVMGLDVRSGKESFKMDHESRHGVVTSICGDNRKRFIIQ